MRRFLVYGLLAAAFFLPTASGHAEEATHWAYQPLLRPALPAPGMTEWVRNPVDAFVAARLEKEGITPSPSAPRHTLIKRLYYDLLGLPPAPEEVEAFVADASTNAYETLVDRLLRSPHFGERWGRHWLDKARYADSDGYEKDRPRPNAWRYRDWVIRAVNDDVPFDRFTTEQLAGDLLAEPTADQLLATAFHRQTLTNTEGGADKEQFRVEAIVDRVNTTGTIWLGLTLGCAQCHSHKYDQVSHEEYYQLFAFFNNTDETSTDVPISELRLETFRAQKATHDRQVAEAQAALTSRTAQVDKEFAAWRDRARSRLGTSAAEFLTLEATKVEAEGSENEFELLDDGSYLVSGANPKRSRYNFFARTDGGITGFRLEALPHESLEDGGPGRRADGAFGVSEFRVYLSKDGKFDAPEQKALEWDLARASSADEGFSIAAAIDGDRETDWRVKGSGEAHTAFFFIESPLDDTSTYLKIVIHQEAVSRHNLGRFRLASIRGDDELLRLPEAARVALRPGAEPSPAEADALRSYYVRHVDEEGRRLGRRVEELQRTPPETPYMKVRVLSEREEDRRRTHLLHRGDFLQPREEVRTATLQVLGAARSPGDGELSRLDLARWLLDERNPLTPRVVVNQIWEHLFGYGLVRSTDDFGVRGEKPSHPQLLDWLATEFRRLGWSRKRFIKTIVMSATYQQSSRHRPELADVDPGNTLLYRQNRFRVEAEIIRDLALAVSGLLEPAIGGPSVFPPMAPDVAALSYSGNFRWKASQAADRYRRGMYTFFKRTAPHPTLTTFDCPDGNTTCAKRRISNTPLQALTQLNNTVFVEAAVALARRVLRERADDDSRVEWLVRLCLARPPTSAERLELSGLLAEGRSWYDRHPDDAKTFVGEVDSPENGAEETAAWTAAARVILNLDEFITRE